MTTSEAEARLFHLAAEGLVGNFDHDFAEIIKLEVILGEALAEKVRQRAYKENQYTGKRRKYRPVKSKRNSRPGICR